MIKLCFVHLDYQFYFKTMFWFSRCKCLPRPNLIFYRYIKNVDNRAFTTSRGLRSNYLRGNKFYISFQSENNTLGGWV